MFKILKTTTSTKTVSVKEMFGVFDGRVGNVSIGDLYTIQKEAEKECKDLLANEYDYYEDATSENIFVVRITKV